MRHRTPLLGLFLLILFLGSATAPVYGGSHLWRINELFSSADGTVQFVEMKECCGASNEIFIANKWVQADASGNQFVFPANLPAGSTANQHLLLATQAFADLPGAPTPDYIIPENFFDLDADTVRYWMYAAAVLEFEIGDLPLDGINSLNGDGSIGINSPTNFSEEEGTVVVPGPEVTFLRGDVNGDGVFNGLVDAIALLSWGFIPGSAAPACEKGADGDDDGIVNPLNDALVLLGALFVPGSAPPPPPYPDCGVDPTDDLLGCDTTCL